MSGLPVRRLTVPGQHRFPRHGHADWSIAAVRAGVGYFRCGGQVHEARAGMVTVLHPGESHDGWVHPEDGLDYVVVTVSEQAALGLHCGRMRSYFADRVVDDPWCARLLLIAHQGLMCGDDAVSLGAEEQVTVAVEQLFRRNARGGHGGGSGPSAAVRLVQDHIDQHHDQRITLPHLAALAQVSPPTLVRRFRAEVGMPPHEYLVSRRVDIARSLLAGGSSTADAAALAGFADQSHLHRHFTRIVGVTPGRFRQPC